MQIKKALSQRFFWLSLLTHIFLIFIFCIHLSPRVKNEMPDKIISAYLYHDIPTPPASVVQSVNQKKSLASPFGILKKNQTAMTTPSKINHVEKKSPSTEAIHLIGDKKNTPKPLIKLLGSALTASLIYPKSAVDFRLTGVAYVRFLIHPDGNITEIQLFKSSSADVLDRAALNAVRAITPLKGVSQYLSEPKYVVFGFIFG